jgi:serine/threonine protein kinase
MTAPTELGRYRVLEPIGRGGMSTVFAGEHVTLRRPVAIKLLHDHLVAEGVMGRRMIDEAHTIAALHHPGIVEVLDVGATDDGRTFVVMERLQGEPLGDRVRRGRLSEERTIAFARQLASALDAAHAAGVVHRDLKPENVFVIPDPDVPGGERVKLLDFGISKREGHARERTLTGVVLGTPAYMAPEQTTGSPDVDARADVYALGVVLYQMVTGGLPFLGANTDELFVEHAFCAPAPAASKAPVSKRLSAIIERCLAKRPEDRYDSMAVLAATLDGLDSGPRGPTSFEDEDTNVEDDASHEVSGEISLAPPAAVLTSESTGRMVRPTVSVASMEHAPADRTERPARPVRQPLWIWPLAAAAAVALGLMIAVLVRPTRAKPARRAPPPTVQAPVAHPSPPPAVAARRVEKKVERKPEPKLEKKPERKAPRRKAPAPISKEEAFAKVETPTLF